MALKVKPVFEAFPEIAALGLQHIGQLGIEWMQSPVARECQITKLSLWQSHTQEKDYLLGYEKSVEPDPSLPADTQDDRFPLPDFLDFIIEHAMAVEQQPELKARVALMRQRAAEA